MPTFISSKDLHKNLSKVSNEVMNGATYVVLKYSKPAYKMIPYQDKKETHQKKYGWDDLDKFLIKGKTKKKTHLSQTYKKILYE